MAVGDVMNSSNATRAICLMVAQSTNNTIPTLATDGVPNYPVRGNVASDTGACFSAMPAEQSTLVIGATSGSGSLTGVFTIYGYLAAFNGGAGGWFPIKVNGGSAVAGTTTLFYAEKFNTLGHFDRLALVVASIGGTSPVFEAWCITGQKSF